MMPNLVTIDITDETSLLQACDILHDARFDLGKAMSDVLAGTWSGVFIREFFEDESLMSESPGLFFTKLTYPMAESVLQLSGIANCDVRDRSRIGISTFNECQPSHGEYRFVFCEGTEIVFTFKEKPTGRLHDVRLMDERGSHLALRNPFRSRPNTR